MPPKVKYEIIRDTANQKGNLLTIDGMCKAAGVSRSGYYNWVNSAPAREERENRDRADFELILEAYRFRGYKKGARSIHMRLLHIGKLMNLKKIRRLMKKYGLKCPIRKANPYRRMAKALKTNTVFPNIVNRQFKAYSPRKVILTDITYLFYKGDVCYLSSVLDVCTHEILAYQLSCTMQVEFVLRTIDDMKEKHGCELDNETIVHSDQGCHYTSKAFIAKLKDSDFIQSMSRKGNCWDNAPQESFFGHMKDEIKSEISECEIFEEVKAIVDDWMDYYNNDRYQWDLLKLSPCEYYRYLITGIYPLQKHQGSRGSAPNPEV